MRAITSILNPKFSYRPSAETDIRKTFAKYRKEQREADRKASESKLAKRRIVAA